MAFKGLRVQRPRKKEALDLVDVFAPEVIHLTGVLNAFGESRETEVLAELDQGSDQGVGFG